MASHEAPNPGAAGAFDMAGPMLGSICRGGDVKDESSLHMVVVQLEISRMAASRDLITNAFGSGDQCPKGRLQMRSRYFRRKIYV
jgi:hypothetical protein